MVSLRESAAGGGGVLSNYVLAVAAGVYFGTRPENSESVVCLMMSMLFLVRCFLCSSRGRRSKHGVLPAPEVSETSHENKSGGEQ